MEIASAPIGSIVPFMGDQLPVGWEIADGTPVETPWSPMFGTDKPDLGMGKPGTSVPGFSHFGPVPKASRVRFIIKVAEAMPVLDAFTQAVFAHEEKP